MNRLKVGEWNRLWIVGNKRFHHLSTLGVENEHQDMLWNAFLSVLVFLNFDWIRWKWIVLMREYLFTEVCCVVKQFLAISPGLATTSSGSDNIHAVSCYGCCKNLQEINHRRVTELTNWNFTASGLESQTQTFDNSRKYPCKFNHINMPSDI